VGAATEEASSLDMQAKGLEKYDKLLAMFATKKGSELSQDTPPVTGVTIPIKHAIQGPESTSVPITAKFQWAFWPESGHSESRSPSYLCR
jgi:hypothetical protein